MIDSEQLDKWKNTPKDRRTSFYTGHFLVPVSSRLRERVSQERELGIFPPCRNLVSIMGHNLNPLEVDPIVKTIFFKNKFDSYAA